MCSWSFNNLSPLIVNCPTALQTGFFSHWGNWARHFWSRPRFPGGRQTAISDGGRIANLIFSNFKSLLFIAHDYPGLVVMQKSLAVWPHILETVSDGVQSQSKNLEPWLWHIGHKKKTNKWKCWKCQWFPLELGFMNNKRLCNGVSAVFLHSAAMNSGVPLTCQ